MKTENHILCHPDQKLLSQFPYQKVEKYIQEIFWRVYWKGWLELRPQVWTDFTEDLKSIEEDKNYQIAVSGKTEIQCFNDWVNELKENNYLHNHRNYLYRYRLLDLT